MRAAERIGYREVRPYILRSIAAAATLYRKFGFEPIAPYHEIPVIGTIFMRRSLIERGHETTNHP